MYIASVTPYTMVINSLNLKLRQIARFSSNMIFDDMSSTKCCLLLKFFLIAQHEERPIYRIHVVTSRLILCSIKINASHADYQMIMVVQ